MSKKHENDLSWPDEDSFLVTEFISFKHTMNSNPNIKHPSFPFYAEYKGESDVSFEHGRKYRVIGKDHDLFQIVDESGESYLYSLAEFDIVE